VKINVYNTDKLEKNVKLKKKKKHRLRNFIAAAGIFVASFSAFGMFDNAITNNSPNLDSTYNSSYTYSAPASTSPSGELKSVGSYDSSAVHLDDDDLGEFHLYINNQDVVYHYDDLYGIDSALAEERNSKPSSDNHTSMIDLEDGKFTAASIYNAIIENNKAYLNDTSISSYKKASFTELDDSKIKEYCTIIANTLNDQIQTNPAIDINELRCVVGNLKMFSSPSTSIAYVNHDDLFVVSPSMVKVSTVIKQSDNTEYDVMVHETMHLIQKSCKDNLDGKTQVGVSQHFDNLNVNSLDWSWYIEGSAENAMSNYTQHEPTTYKYLISYLKSLNLATILDDNVSVHDLDNVNFDKDIQKFYEIFGCENEEDKKEVIRMMYSVEVMQQQKDDFKDAYQAKYGLSLDDEENLVPVQRELKASICESLTKYFYRNLGNAVNQGKLTYGDLFFLIRTFEGDLNSHLDCSSTEKFSTNEEFMKVYLGIQNEFFQEIADTTGKSLSEITSLFNGFEYGLNDSLLRDIDSSKRDFIIDRAKEVASSSHDSIATIYSNFTDSKVK